MTGEESGSAHPAHLGQAARGRSSEAEHRDILDSALFDNAGAFAERASSMRRRLRSSVDSTETIRAARDRDYST